jgi:hypothetical protein
MIPFTKNNTVFGLTQTDPDTIVAGIICLPDVWEAIIFGSPAKGNYTAGSDMIQTGFNNNAIGGWPTGVLLKKRLEFYIEAEEYFV